MKKSRIKKARDGAPRSSRSVRQEPALSERSESKGGDVDSATITLADHLHSAAIHLLRRVRQQDTATGEGPARLSALSVLVFGGPKTLGELAAAEQVKPPTMSRIVTGLARGGLITITADADDARRLQIRASTKGTRLVHEARYRRVADLAQHLGALAPLERETLSEATEILRHLLQDWTM